MARKVVVICGSPYKTSNSDALAREFAAGALEAGNTVEIVKLAEKQFGPCLGCDLCRKREWECVQRDDMEQLYSLVEAADIIVLATPLYFLTVSAQLKAFIDRLYCRHHAGSLRGKKGVLLSTSGGPDSAALKDYFAALCGLVGWENSAVLTQGGLGGRAGSGPDEATKAQAYELGKQV